MNDSLARILSVGACLLLACAGCATKAKSRTPAPTAEVLLKADRDFASSAQQHGVANAFREFAAPDAVSLPMGEAPIHGREAIFRAMSDFPSGELLWKPIGADLARSGELGCTWGTYEFHPRAAQGSSAARHGKCVTIWKKQTDGSWKFVLDTGNASPPSN